MKPNPIPRADVISPGHAPTRRCDACNRFTSQTLGGSYFRKTMWHCPACTAARKASTGTTA
jgi:hypothetical protein